MSLTSLINDFEKGKKLAKASNIKKDEKESKNLEVMLQKAKGLLVKEKLKDLTKSMSTIQELRDYVGELMDMGLLPPEVIGNIMKQEVEHNKNITEYLKGDTKTDDEKSPLNLFTQINNTYSENTVNQDNRTVDINNASNPNSNNASKQTLELVQKMHLFEEHLKSEIDKIELPKGTVEIIVEPHPPKGG